MDFTQIYRTRFLPGFLDVSMKRLAVMRQRQKIVPRAYGTVLEIGFGSGLNLDFYDPSRVTKVIGVEPAEEMRKLAQERIEASRIAVSVIDCGAEALPIDPGVVDTVLFTYTLCSIRDVVGALREAHRVLRKDGQLLFCEHGLARDFGVRCCQHVLTPLWQAFRGGCHLNRDIPSLLELAGFSIVELQRGYLPGLRPMTFNYEGVAFPARG